MQSFNSLNEVTKLENYKVFLNPNKRNELLQALQAFRNNPAAPQAQAFISARNKVINAWENGGVFSNSNIRSKFSTYWDDIEIENAFDFKNLLKNNDDWFEEIFIKNFKNIE